MKLFSTFHRYSEGLLTQIFMQFTLHQHCWWSVSSGFGHLRSFFILGRTLKFTYSLINSCVFALEFICLIKTIVVRYKKWMVLINYINMRFTCRLRKTHEKCVMMSHFSYQNNWKEIFGDRVNWDIYNELPKQTKIEIQKNIYII